MECLCAITPGSLIFTPTGTETYYEGEIIAENTNLSIGFIGCNGSEYEFDDVYVENLDAINLDNLSLRIDAIESSESGAASLSFNTGTIFIKSYQDMINR